MEQEYFEPVFQCGSTNRVEEADNHLFTGGCGRLIPLSFSYRCGECTAFFHRHCLYDHFEKESDKTKGGSMKEFLAESRRRAKKDEYPSNKN